LERAGVPANTSANLRSSRFSLRARRCPNFKPAKPCGCWHATADALWHAHVGPAGARSCLRGIVIVRGLVRGIDAIAHQGAVTANGRAIGVLGTSVDICYPKENKKVYEKVLERGAILSESPLGAHPPGKFSHPQSHRCRDATRRNHHRGCAIFRLTDFRPPGHGIWPRSIRRARKRHASGKLRAEPSNQAGRQAGDLRRGCNRRASDSRSPR